MGRLYTAALAVREAIANADQPSLMPTLITKNIMGDLCFNVSMHGRDYEVVVKPK